MKTDATVQGNWQTLNNFRRLPRPSRKLGHGAAGAWVWCGEACGIGEKVHHSTTSHAALLKAMEPLHMVPNDAPICRVILRGTTPWVYSRLCYQENETFLRLLPVYLLVYPKY